MLGTVKFFKASEHWGIVFNEGGEWFFHGSNLIGEVPQAGEEVEFWLADGTRDNRLAAVEVQRRTA